MTRPYEPEPLQTLQQKVARFCQERDWDQFHSMKELAIGLVTESAELLDLFRFLTPAQMEALKQTPSKQMAIEHELADVFFFLLRFAQLHQIDLVQALEKKMALNGQKYPVEKCKGKNLKYSDYEI